MNLTTLMRAPSFMNAGTVWAIIRKDMGALWPYALALAIVVLLTAARMHHDFPDVVLDFGRSQLHLAAVVFILGMFGVPIAVAAFIVVLVHQDPAANARHDWMTRPIGALEIVAAKALAILTVILIPSIIGNFGYVATHNTLSIEAATGPIVFTMIGCTTMLVVAWLSSSTVQALIAPLGLAVIALLAIVALGLPLSVGVESFSRGALRPTDSAVSVARRLPPAPPAPRAPPAPERAAAAPKGQPAAAPTIESPQPANATQRVFRQSINPSTVLFEGRRADPRIELSWPLVVTELLLMLTGASVVLWLLLVRRRLLSARLAFLGFFLGATFLLLLLESSIYVARDSFVSISTSIRPAASEQERVAAFVNNDGNKDGRLTKQEYSAVLDELGFSGQLESLWSQRDIDRDGFVSVDEYRAPIPSVPAPVPITPEPERIAAFASNDRNRDNRLDRWEYSALLDQLGYTGQFPSLWSQRDGDADGYVSVEEYKKPMQ